MAQRNNRSQDRRRRAAMAARRNDYRVYLHPSDFWRGITAHRGTIGRSFVLRRARRRTCDFAAFACDEISRRPSEVGSLLLRARNPDAATAPTWRRLLPGEVHRSTEATD